MVAERWRRYAPSSAAAERIVAPLLPEPSSDDLVRGGINAAASAADEYMECVYIGTDFLEVKIYLIGVFATSLAIISLFFNAFFTLVFALNPSLRRSPLYYFGILALLDTIMAVNYLALMAVPVYMDQFQWFWLYRLFLLYLRPMLTLSNCAMFSSVLMILLATVERYLNTFHSHNLSHLRKFMESRRPQVCLCLILLAVFYKACTYFEIHYIEHENCQGWERYEIQPTELAENPNYKLWWMFVARNLIDRIVPFFALVTMNFLIIRTLKRGTANGRGGGCTPTPSRNGGTTGTAVSSTTTLASPPPPSPPSPLSALPPIVEERSEGKTDGDGTPLFAPPPDDAVNGTGRRRTRSWGRRLRRVESANAKSGGGAEDAATKKNLRDATRALLAIVTMYLMSQTLQVLITFWEAFWKVSLENEFTHFYSFVNDVMSILTLLSSALRFPVYCSISTPISRASRKTVRWLCQRGDVYGGESHCDSDHCVVVHVGDDDRRTSKQQQQQQQQQHNQQQQQQQQISPYDGNGTYVAAPLCEPDDGNVTLNEDAVVPREHNIGGLRDDSRPLLPYFNAFNVEAVPPPVPLEPPPSLDTVINGYGSNNEKIVRLASMEETSLHL